jgi:hypothetical protein
LFHQSLSQQRLCGQNQAHTIDVCIPNTAPKHTSMQLPLGTQQKAVDAATLAERIGAPINRLLTIRTHAMRITGGGGIFRLGTQAECVRIFLDKNLHWMKYRRMPTANIWSREYSGHHSEHFHFGFHQHDELDADYAHQLSEWLDEGAREWGTSGDLIVQSTDDNWNIKRCIRGNTSGCNMAAYITKAEPSKIVTGWGKTKTNERKPKPYRGKRGGEGPIEGNGKHAYRWGTSTLIGRTQRDRHGYAQ